MTYSKTKSTKRFKFTVNRDTKSHKSGANTVTIYANDVDPKTGRYNTATGTFSDGDFLTMTVKEAKAFHSFLAKYIN
jgi:hypothetical protein